MTFGWSHRVVRMAALTGTHSEHHDGCVNECLSVLYEIAGQAVRYVLLFQCVVGFWGFQCCDGFLAPASVRDPKRSSFLCTAAKNTRVVEGLIHAKDA